MIHELGGHGVLYNHVSSANFRFAHSAGDSIAAILADAGSQAADRFLTFPWVGTVISRRHDRLPERGLGMGRLDRPQPVQHESRQQGVQQRADPVVHAVPSVPVDRRRLERPRCPAVRRTDGDLPDPAGHRHPDAHDESANAAGFEAALETADAGDWVPLNLTGGAYRKVIRWAFEKQGMFQPTGTATPNNNAGSPPAVDVYVPDARDGEYTFQEVFWDNQNIWNRLAADGGTAHQDPVTNRTNYAYVKIRNRGTQTATNVTVKALPRQPGCGPVVSERLAADDDGPAQRARTCRRTAAARSSWSARSNGPRAMWATSACS